MMLVKVIEPRDWNVIKRDFLKKQPPVHEAMASKFSDIRIHASKALSACKRCRMSARLSADAVAGLLEVPLILIGSGDSNSIEAEGVVGPGAVKLACHEAWRHVWLAL